MWFNLLKAQKKNYSLLKGIIYFEFQMIVNIFSCIFWKIENLWEELKICEKNWKSSIIMNLSYLLIINLFSTLLHLFLSLLLLYRYIYTLSLNSLKVNFNYHDIFILKYLYIYFVRPKAFFFITIILSSLKKLKIDWRHYLLYSL